MTLSLYDVTIPVFTRALHTMSGLLDTGRTWADESGLEHDELLQAQLYPDMKPLIHHVRLACDTARLTAVGYAVPGPVVAIGVLLSLVALANRTKQHFPG